MKATRKNIAEITGWPLPAIRKIKGSPKNDFQFNWAKLAKHLKKRDGTAEFYEKWLKGIRRMSKHFTVGRAEGSYDSKYWVRNLQEK